MNTNMPASAVYVRHMFPCGKAGKEYASNFYRWHGNFYTCKTHKQ